MADESLIRAVELRLRHLPPDQLEKVLQDADQSGFVLMRTFVTQLQKFEKAQPAMSYYLGDIIAGIDVEAEQRRVKALTFAVPGPEVTLGMQTASENDPSAQLERGLSEGEREIAGKDAAGSDRNFRENTCQVSLITRVRAVWSGNRISAFRPSGARRGELFEKPASPR